MESVTGFEYAHVRAPQPIDMKLTTDEIKLVVFLLSMLLLGAGVKYYRHRDGLNIPPPGQSVSSTGKAQSDSD